MVEVVADQEACVQRMWQGGGLTEGKVVPTTVSSWYDSGIRLAPLSDVESEYDDDAAQTEAAQSDRATRNAVEPAAPTATAMATGAESYVPMSMESLREAEGRESGIFALTLVVGYIVLGVGVYSTATDWSVLQSLYYVVVTLTSVGYGDLTVDTDAMRLFTCGYILIGVGVLGTALGEVISSLLNTDSTPAGKLIRWLSGAQENTENDENPVAATLAPTLVTVAVTLLVGAGALLYLSPELRPVEALYYSVVTVTTVGYGDYTPQTDAARAFITGYALFGTILLARSLAAIADIPLERRRKYQQQLVLDQYGGELDPEELQDLQQQLIDLGLCDMNRGYCTTSDFALAMLVRQDKCSADDVKRALVTFNKLDIDGSGELDEGDVQAWIERQQGADVTTQ